MKFKTFVASVLQEESFLIFLIIQNLFISISPLRPMFLKTPWETVCAHSALCYEQMLLIQSQCDCYSGPLTLPREDYSLIFQ